MPDDLYWVSRMPAAIVGMAYPGRADWAQLHAEGVGHVVCLTHDAVPYDASPCTASPFRLQDLVSGGPPLEPERERAVVERAAADVVDHVRRGIGVAVHCMGGRGRTGTVVGVALVRLGHDPDTVVDYLHRVAVGRGRRGWPESPWQADTVRDARRRYPDFRSESVSRIWPTWYVTMMTTAAHASGRTKRSHAMRLSDPAKSTAPAAATTLPDAIVEATIAEMTTMYTATGGRSAGSRSSARSTRTAIGADREHDHDQRDDQRRRARRVGPEADHVADVRDEERGQPGNERVARQHQEDVTRE